MTETESPRVFGRPVAEAAAVLASVDGPDATTVEEDIALFVDDGVVSRDRVDEAVAGLAKVVSTPETRVEVAAREVERAHEAAADAADLETVAHRLDALDERLTAVEPEVEALSDRLSAVVDDAKDPATLHETAQAVRALTDDANAVQLAADSLRDDAEATVEWARAHETRRREFGDDLAAVAESVDGVAATVAWLAGDADDPPAPADEDDPGRLWAEASVGVRVADLLVADLRSELADLRTWAGREGSEPVLEDEASDLDALADRRDRLADRLDDLARPAWRDAHGDRVTRAAATLDSFAPPTEWGAVQAALGDT